MPKIGDMLLLNMVQTAASRRTADPSRPLSDFSPTFKKSRLGMFSGLLTQTLRKRLTDFQSALDRFAWPSTKSTSLTARLADMDEDLNNKVTARLHYDDDARPANRFFSRGLDGSATTSLETGTYKTVLTLGGRSDTVTFDIEYGDTNRDVFDAFAEQVNKSSLDVQAEVFTQTGAEAKVEGVFSTGTILGLSVNRRAIGDDLELSDTRGNFLRLAEFSSTAFPVAGPTRTGYSLTASSVYRPSSFDGNSFDPNAPTTLNPGTYSVAYAIGGEAETFDLEVSSDDTWKDVLQSLALNLNSVQDRFKMETETVDVPYYDPSMSGIKSVKRFRGTVTAVDPKLDWQLELSENSGDYTAAQLNTPLLSTLGLEGTAQPGSNAEIRVNGRDMEAAGDFTLDQGRLSLGVDSTFGDPGNLQVRDPQTVLQNNLTDIVSAYNDLYSLLRVNSDILAEDLPGRFSGPYKARQDDLAAIGLRNGEKDSLSLAPDAFSTAYAAEPEDTGILLADASRGLIPQWQQAVEQTLEQQDADLVRAPNTLKKLDFSFENALNNEFRSLIMDLLG